METARKIVEMVKSHQCSAEDQVNLALQRIKEVEPEIHAFIKVAEDQAIQSAREIDARITRGEKMGSLCGVPIAVKDVISTANIETTCGSKILKGYIPPFDATVIERLKQEGAIIIGKTNTDEFAMGNSTEFSSFGPTKNPRDKTRVPGGSSGGSAAAVASLEVPLALGTDTGGSIRCPAAFCGIVGLKPTYGRVSRYGLISYANSLEQIGPLARNVDDCAILMKCLAGWDPRDSTSYESPMKKVSTKGFSIKSKIAVPKQFFGEGTEDLVKKEVWRILDRLSEFGCIVEEISLNNLEYALPTYYITAMAEASSNLAKFDGLKYGSNVKTGYRDWNTYFTRNRESGFGGEVKRRIIIGTFTLSAGYFGAYYLKAQKIRTMITKEIENVFKKYDLIAGPTMPTTPFLIGEKINDPLQMYMNDVDTVSANLTGHPAISIPINSKVNAPIGIQLLAPFFREEELLKAGKLIEEKV